VVEGILRKVRISIEEHGSVGVAVVGHYDCAGNPASREEQIGHLQEALRLLRPHCGDLELLALWVGEEWVVEEVSVPTGEGEK
jgi:carbonic anhydrase